MNINRVLYQLPRQEEDESLVDFFRRMQKDFPDVPVMELMEACRLKCQQEKARDLLAQVETGDSYAMQEAIMWLLKETYKL